MMTDENKKDDGFSDDNWLIEDDENVIEPSNIVIWKDCITPLTVNTVTDALSFLNIMNEQLSKWCASDKLSKYVYSLNIDYEDENGLRDIRQEYVDLLTGIQSVQNIVGKMKEQLMIGLAESYYGQ